MNRDINPFLTSGYISPAYFCDRESELKALARNAKNDINTTLISARRYGKSALIYRLFEELERKNDMVCIYVDVYPSRDLKDFTGMLAHAIMERLPPKRGIGKRFLDVVKGFRPVITYDLLTDRPALHFEFVKPKECEQTLSGIFQFLDTQNLKVLLAIDEFQQVAVYPEKNAEALLRSIMQKLKNVGFIFSGSNRHLMNEIFSSAKRPFFSSTQMLGIGAIPGAAYKKFIRWQFTNGKREISDEAIDFIMEWTCVHTYYTQMLCKNVYAARKKKVDLSLVKSICHELLASQQVANMQYRNLLTSVQWSLLIAVAKEEKVYQPQSKVFLEKYDLGAASSIQKALDTLLVKEMIYRTDHDSSAYYRVYDVFLLRWLQKTY
jgi:uncharacterized protein